MAEKRKINVTSQTTKKKSKKEEEKGPTSHIINKKPKRIIGEGEDKNSDQAENQKANKTQKFIKSGNKLPVKSAQKKPKTLKDVQKFKKNGVKKSNAETKPEDWNLFKKQKKELKLKRKQAKSNFDVVVQAKKLSELLRRKQLKDGAFQRNNLVNDLHNMLKSDGNYSKFVMAHDTARIVQWMLKFSSALIRQEIFKELKGSIPAMIQSKYGVFCIKRLLKYGNSKSRSEIVKAFYGKAVKLASHAVSAPYLEYAYSTWATPQQKLHLVQEFYGDMYKNSKDDNVKSLQDVFKTSPDLKTAALGATKANLSRILNKNLLDSGLVQTVVYQFLLECSAEDRAEMISQLASHIVVISNSKDGSRAAMQCIWQGTNKDRKILMKSLKEHLVALSKHEYGHCTVITLLDAADDTVLLNKIIISEILKNAKDLSMSEWGRKVLLWLIVPDDSSYFHPQFIKELSTGRENSTIKKPIDVRRKEILAFSSATLLNLVTTEPEMWLSDSKLAYEMLAIIKSATGKELEYAFESMIKKIADLNWKLKEGDKEVMGIEHAAMHLVLKKIAQHDKINLQNGLPTFGESFIKHLSTDVIESWLELNRGCFLLILVFENNSEDVQNQLKIKILPFKKKLAKLNSQGAKILLKKIS